MQYAWLIWSLILIGIWLVVYVLLGSKEQKKEMLVVSFWTSLTGLTEPLFVPRYWSPPSLFNLNVLTGFDIESIIWAFGVGGIVAVLYEFIFRARRHSHLPHSERQQRRHRLHYLTIGATPILLMALLLTTGWNPIYSSIAALLIGGFAAWYCRPDLKPKMIASAFLFLAVYFLYFLTLTAMYPAYVEAVWNLPELSGVLVAGVPLEELLFAFSFGFMWSSIYEHFGWYRLAKSS